MTDDEIRALWLQTQERITELSLEVYALQSLLQQTGAFSKADVDVRVEEFRKLFSARFRHHLEERQKQALREELDRLLAGYEGTKQ